jgi:hypothetical protein
MAKLTDARVNTLQDHFNSGDQPTEANFADLVQWIQEGIEEHDHDGTGDGDGMTFDTLTLKASVANSELSLRTFDVGAAESRIYFDKSDHNTIGTLAETDDGDWLGFLGFRGVGSGLGWSYGAYIYAAQVGAAGVANVETDLYFVTGNNAGVNTLHLVLDGGTGYTGLGVTPTYPLDVYHATVNAIAQFESGDPFAQLYLKDDTTVQGEFVRRTGDLTDYYGGGIKHLRLDSTGKVIVGPATAAAAGQLHVDQDQGVGAIPVLVLDQADVSEGFINFIGDERGVIGEGTNSLKSARVELNGTVYRIALYADG